MDELLDFTPNDTPKPIKITAYGKIFYGLEFALWLVSLMMFTMFSYMAFIMVPVFLLFYLFLGMFFPFYAGVFVHKSDKILALAGLQTIALLLAALIFNIMSWPFSTEMALVSVVVNVMVTLLVIGRTLPATSMLILGVFENVSVDTKVASTKHLSYLLLRLIPVFMLSILFFVKKLL